MTSIIDLQNEIISSLESTIKILKETIEVNTEHIKSLKRLNEIDKALHEIAIKEILTPSLN